MAGTKRITRQALKTIGIGEVLWDGELKGFGARRQKDAVTFFLKRRFEGLQLWMTIGQMGNPWTLDSARAEALRRVLAIADGVDPRKQAHSADITLKEGLEQFLQIHGPKLKERTRCEYERLCVKDIVPRLGKFGVNEDLTAEIEKFHGELCKTPRKANTILAVLSKFFNWAEEGNLRREGKNPCSRIKKYRETRRQRFLSSTELKRLGRTLDKCEDDGSVSVFALAAVRLLIFTGARLSEILTLKWSYVDLERGRLLLPDSKTGAKVIRLNKAALAVLEAVPKVAGNTYVVVGDRQGAHLVGLQKVWQRIRKAAGIEDVRLHDLRHSFASVAAETGASLSVIGKLLGHSSVQTTGRYAHLTEQSIDKANEEVGEQIFGAMSLSEAEQLQHSEG